MDELQYQLDLLTAMNEKLRGAEKMYELICNTSTDAFLYCDFTKMQFEMLGAFKDWIPFEIHREADLNLLVEHTLAEYRGSLRNLLFMEQFGKVEERVECCMEDGKFWIEFTGNVKYDKDGVPINKIIRMRDITKMRKQKEELTYLAYYDMLTGLYNRNKFIKILGDWVERAKEEKAVFSVMCIDIDNFKKYNDGFGMLIGDELIQAFGLFLKEFQKENVIVTHANNDIFYIAVFDPYSSQNEETIYEAIRERLKEPFVVTGPQHIKFHVSVGVARFPEAGKNALEMMNCAEIVMFRAKEVGGNCIKYFEAQILSDFIENFNMESKLKTALEDQEFLLYFQPQYDAQTKVLRGVEALIRWRTPDGKLVSPGSFIPLAEQNGLIVPIGDWVVEEGIRIYTQWKEKYHVPLILSLNVSAIQYKQQNFIPHLLRVMEKYQVSPSEIELEITESVLIDDFSEMIEKLLELKDYGIKISLDDFGTGYSSLSYLKGLPIDTLKIDKTFIDTVLDDSSTRVITESIVSMVRKLGYETVAEGVETEEQYDYLRKINCDNIQGFLLGRPMPAEKIEELLLKKSGL